MKNALGFISPHPAHFLPPARISLSIPAMNGHRSRSLPSQSRQRTAPHTTISDAHPRTQLKIRQRRPPNAIRGSPPCICFLTGLTFFSSLVFSLLFKSYACLVFCGSWYICLLIRYYLFIFHFMLPSYITHVAYHLELIIFLKVHICY